jgi:hypothetical protein
MRTNRGPTFVRTLLQLAIVGGLLNEVEDLLRESLVCDGPGSAWVIGHCEVGFGDVLRVVLEGRIDASTGGITAASAHPCV